MEKSASVCARKTRAWMFAKSARATAAADTSLPPARAFAAALPRSRKKCLLPFAMRSPLHSEIDGVLLVDKAAGMTSHDVVALVRRRLGFKKIGHCGTLDPLATGLLILVLGRGTKIQDLLMSEDKEYVGTLTLGVTTDSQDADGKVVETKPVGDISRDRIAAVFAKFH